MAVFGRLWQSLAVFGRLWQSVTVCGSLWPPEVLDSVLEEPFSFPSFPVRTQTVERAVKLVTEASHQVLQTCKHQTNKQTNNQLTSSAGVREEARHGHILNVMDSRRRRSMFDTKKDYSVKE